jgi:hypothetical protein
MRGASAVEAEDELVKIGLEMRLPQAVEDTFGPGLQVGEDGMDPAPGLLLLPSQKLTVPVSRATLISETGFCDSEEGLPLPRLSVSVIDCSGNADCLQ